MSLIFEALQGLETERIPVDSPLNVHELEFLRCAKGQVALNPEYASTERSLFDTLPFAQAAYPAFDEGLDTCISTFSAPQYEPAARFVKKRASFVPAKQLSGMFGETTSPNKRQDKSRNQKPGHDGNEFNFVAAVAVGVVAVSLAMRIARRPSRKFVS
jgi:hypothetical protein